MEALTPITLKVDTNMRECIKQHEMVWLPLRYLASGETFRSFEFQFTLERRLYLVLLLMFVEPSLRVWDHVMKTRPETLVEYRLEIGWELLRNSTNDGTSRMVSRHY